jgi:ankyrin repeat protein
LAEDLVKCRALIAAGAKIDAQDNHGNTPLHNASYHNSVATVKILLAHKGCKEALKLRTTEGDSALDYACSNGHVEVAKLLVAGGADINAQDSRGWGPLHNACTKYNSKSLELVEFLLESGADPLLLNSDGQKPYDITREKSIKAALKVKMDSLQADMDFLDGGMEF